MSYLATEIVRLRPPTKERFNEYVGVGKTHDRAISDLLDLAGVPG